MTKQGDYLRDSEFHLLDRDMPWHVYTEGEKYGKESMVRKKKKGTEV